MATVYICDRCGASQHSKLHRVSSMDLAIMTSNDPSYFGYDLCTNCAEILRAYVKNWVG